MPEFEKNLPPLPSQPREDVEALAKRVATQAKAEFEAENPDSGGYGTWLAGGGYIQRSQLRGKGALDILLGPLEEPDPGEV